jgi:mRNA-degrading endonuclease toxin of MazEF toxin-antitoxin module
MSAPRRGEIVWLRVPPEHVVGSEQFGHPDRPYLVVSHPNLGARGMGIACAITSSAKGPLWDWHVLITPADVRTRGVEPGLDHAGVIRVEQVRIFDLQRLVTLQGAVSPVVGRLTPLKMAEVEVALREVLVLP